MASKRISQSITGRTFILQLLNNRYFTSTRVSKKDSQSGNVSVTASPSSSEKSSSAGQANVTGQSFSKSNSGSTKINTLLTPTLKQNVDQTASTLHPRPVDPILETRRELPHSGSVGDKGNVHILKTHLDQPSSNPQDDASLLASRRVDPSTVRQVYYFDTLAFVKKLESKGFSREQAEGCAECLVEIINTTLDHQGRHMVTKPQQEIAVQQLMSEIVLVKKDMTLLQKSEFSSLKTETEKMSIELSQIQGHLNDEIVKLKGQFSLDINLERGRAIEAHAENEKKLQQLHNKIETEIANLKTIYEVYRNDVFKYAGGTVIAVGGLMLGVIRLWH